MSDIISKDPAYGYAVMVWKLPKYLLESSEHIIRAGLERHTAMFPAGQVAKVMCNQISEACNGTNALLLLSEMDERDTRGFKVMRDAIHGVNADRIERAQAWVDRMRAGYIQDTEAIAWEEEGRRFVRRQRWAIAIVKDLEDAALAGAVVHDDLGADPFDEIEDWVEPRMVPEERASEEDDPDYYAWYGFGM